MPGLPEIETVRRGLTSLIEGKTIAEVRVLWPKLIDLRPQRLFGSVAQTTQTADHLKQWGRASTSWNFWFSGASFHLRDKVSAMSTTDQELRLQTCASDHDV